MFRFGRVGAKRLLHTASRQQTTSFGRNAAYWATSASVLAVAFAASSSIYASAQQKESSGPKSISEESISVDVKPLTDSDVGLKPEGPYNEETGEINWDCPCLGGMADGPCGAEFKEAFSCFVYSKEEPKGIECVQKFAAMQDCFRLHPEVYADQLDADEKAALAEPSGAGEAGESKAVPAAKVNETVKDAAATVKENVKDAAETVKENVREAVDSVKEVADSAKSSVKGAASAVADKVGLNSPEPVTEAELANPDIVVVEEDIVPLDVVPVDVTLDAVPVTDVEIVVPVDADSVEEAMGVVDGSESKSEADELRQANKK